MRRVRPCTLVEPIRENFWKRFDGNVSAGLSFTKASDVLQFSLGGSARYRTLKALTELRLNTSVTTSDETASTNADFRLTHFRFFADKWSYLGVAGATRNDEQGMDLRANLAGGIGRSILQSHRRVLLLATLLSGNRELTNDGNQTDNLELVIATSFRGFRYDTPKLDVNADATFFVNLITTPPR